MVILCINPYRVLAPNRVLQSIFPQVNAEKWPSIAPTGLPFTISVHLSVAFFHFYRERIWLTSSPFCLSCGGKPHTIFHIFSCLSHPTSLTEKKYLRERLHLASEWFFYLFFFDHPSLPSHPAEPPS